MTGAAALSLILLAISAHGQVILNPGDNIQTQVNANPANTVFILSGGTYANQSVVPKSGDQFIGESGATLDGSLALSAWNLSSGLWVSASGWTTPGQVNGMCDGTHPACDLPEDLFFDNQPKLRVAPSAGSCPAAVVSAGEWCLDYTTGNVYSFDAPAGHTTTMSVTRYAFCGRVGCVGAGALVSNVVISGITVQKYAIPAQMGAIGDQYPGTNWTLDTVEAWLNHGRGINVSSGSTVTNSRAHHNGQMGIGGGGTAVMVRGTDMSYNNYAGFDCGWECGGLKFAQATQLTVTTSRVHDNLGPGLWCDIDCTGTMFTQNNVWNNRDGGISIEISCGYTVRSNNICGNGEGQTNPKQIFSSTSYNGTISGNSVYNPLTGSNIGSISVTGVSRGAGGGVCGTYASNNNQITGNHITSPALAIGVNSLDAGAEAATPANVFDRNDYHVTNPTGSNYWLFGSGVFQTFAAWQMDGEDVHGSVDAILPTWPCTGGGTHIGGSSIH